jgi:REP element-mobilizing transposase RayT
MPQSLARLLVHVVYGTKHRQELLPAEPYVDLHKFIRGVLLEVKCHLVEMNNTADHVHVLFDLHRTEALSHVVMHMKSASSRWLKQQSTAFKSLTWQDGHGAFSLGESQREAAVQYVRDQQNHHRTRSFEDEFRELLHKYRIEYDERYVWD